MARMVRGVGGAGTWEARIETRAVEPLAEDLNQRDWVNLEDYVLGNAKTHNLKVTVFTGPIFGEKDQLYRGLVRLPQAFWKIAVVINSETKKLSVTGYILCQGSLIKDLTSEFVYGAFRTYQVPLTLIAEQARLFVGCGDWQRERTASARL